MLAGSSGTIHVANCADAEPLLSILGYRARPACGQKDSALSHRGPGTCLPYDRFRLSSHRARRGPREGRRFLPTPSPTPAFRCSLPKMIGRRSAPRRAGARNRWLTSCCTSPPSTVSIGRSPTAMPRPGHSLQRAPGLARLLPYGPVLDFYGTQICIRGGRVVVPGGNRRRNGLEGTGGRQPKVPRGLCPCVWSMQTTVGWQFILTPCSRVSGPQQAYLTANPRIRRLYEAFSEPEPKAYPARAVFRKAPALLMLFTRLQRGPDGEPRVPGNLDVWKQILARKPTRKSPVTGASARAHGRTPNSCWKAWRGCLASIPIKAPLQIYLTLNEMDSRRAPDKRLTPETVLLLANKFSQLSSWYLVFSEFPELERRVDCPVCQGGRHHRRHLQPQPARKCDGRVSG